MSSNTFPTRRSYHSCPPISSDVRPRLSGVDLLSTLTSRMQDRKLVGRFTDAGAESHNGRLSSLRFALGSDDPVRLRDAFEDLLEHSSLDALTARDLEMISRMLHNHLSFCPSVQSVMAGARAMAVKVASKGQLDALRTYLLLHLRCGDIQSVTSTYDEFASFLTTPQTPHADQAVLSDDSVDKDVISLAMLDPKPTLPRSPDPHLTDMLLTVIAAYAAQDRFDDALHRFMLLPTSLHVPASRAKAFCDVHFSHDPALSNKVQLWTQDLVQLRLVSRPSALQNYVSNLANETNVSSLLKLYSSTIAGCRSADGKLLVVNRGDPEDGRKRTILSIAVWDIFIQGFFKCNRADLAERLWSDVTELGLSPNCHMWTTMLVGYGRQGQCKAAMAIWNRMLEAGVEPSGRAYGAMIQIFFRARRPLEGFALFQQYKKQSGSSPEGHSLHDPTMLPLFNIVLHGLCQNRMDSEAKNVMKDMMDHGPKPDIVSYNTFLRHYGRMGDMKSVASVLRALKSANIQPDVHSYTTLLSALYKGGTRDAHTRLIQIMETMGVQPNVAMYSAIIDFLVRQGGQENLRNAAMLLQLMENHPDKECRPNEITYTGILAGLHRDRTIPAQDVKSYTESLFAQMHKNGTPPNRTTYHYLIKGSLENPEAQGLQMALGYYREMGKRGIVLTDRTWYVILSSLLRRGDWAIAGEVMSDMFGQGHKPDSALAILVQRVRREISLNS